MAGARRKVRRGKKRHSRGKNVKGRKERDERNRGEVTGRGESKGRGKLVEGTESGK